MAARRFWVAAALAGAVGVVGAVGVAQPVWAQAPAASAATLRQPADKPVLHYLTPAQTDPRRLFAPPPETGSVLHRQEIAYLHALIAAQPKERIAQARADGQNESPSIYDAALGRPLASLPATWNLLVALQDEADAIADNAKGYFLRIRPYAYDASMPTCNPTKASKAFTSYPSGHAAVGYSLGWALARLVPARAQPILARADDYALSRHICGVHYPSDTQASHVMAVLVVEHLLADPRLAQQVAAAKAELAGVQ
jgi:acid phosphatase (class A)